MDGLEKGIALLEAKIADGTATSDDVEQYDKLVRLKVHQEDVTEKRSVSAKDSKNNRITSWVTIGVTAIGMVGGFLMNEKFWKEALHFEETGTFTSYVVKDWFRGAFQQRKPKG